MKPLVDVAMFAYNHERYTAQAIESVLAQKTDFSVRIVIGDDCSTDNTQAIIRKYVDAYPDRIQAILYSQHKGIVSPERLAIKVLGACTAEYVALLDSDDYWIDPYKLSKQIEVLQKLPECAGCFHNTLEIYEDSPQATPIVPGIKQIVKMTLDDLLKTNPICSSAAVYRSFGFEVMPADFYQCVAGDWFLHAMHAQHGYFVGLPDVMSVYRMHTHGIWAGMSEEDRMKQHRKSGEQVAQYIEKLNLQAAQLIQTGQDCYRQKNYPAAEQNFLQALELSRSNIVPLTWLGQVNFENQHYEVSMEYYSKALRINPGDSNALLGMLELAKKFDSQDMMLKSLEKLQALAEKDPKVAARIHQILAG
jgi:glycosyltransferase involved in cell wall biosynthesis